MHPKKGEHPRGLFLFKLYVNSTGEKHWRLKVQKLGFSNE